MKKQKRLYLSLMGAVLVICSILLLSGTVLATPIITFNELSGSSGSNSNQSVGWQFDVLEQIEVTGLGWYDQYGNGLGSEHTVGIWNQSGTLLTSILVPIGTGASLDGVYRTMDISPITLTVGNGYIVGGQNFSDSEDRLTYNVSQVVDSRINFVDATYGLIGGGFERPTYFSAANNGFYGPMFSIDTAPVPEPGTMLLLGIGLAGLLGFRKKLKI